MLVTCAYMTGRASPWVMQSLFLVQRGEVVNPAAETMPDRSIEEKRQRRGPRLLRCGGDTANHGGPHPACMRPRVRLQLVHDPRRLALVMARSGRSARGECGRRWSRSWCSRADADGIAAFLDDLIAERAPASGPATVVDPGRLLLTHRSPRTRWPVSRLVLRRWLCRCRAAVLPTWRRRRWRTTYCRTSSPVANPMTTVY